MFLGLVSVVGCLMVSVTFLLWLPLRLFMVSVTLFMVSVAGLLVVSAAARGSNILERLKRFLVCCVFETGFRRWLSNGFLYALLWFPLRCLMISVAGLLVDSAASRGSTILERLKRFLVVHVFRTGFRRCFCLRLPLCFVVMVSFTFVYGFRYVVYGFRRWIFGGFCRRRRIQHFRTSKAIPRLLCF